MEIIDEKKFEEADITDLQDRKDVTEEEFQKLLEDMQNPVEAQKYLAVQIKMFLDKRIKEETEDKGILSDHTRRWVESYTSILEKIQKALYGDKSVSLHMHNIVSHTQIATRVRQSERE